MDMEHAWLLPAIPAVAFVVLLIAGPYLPRRGDWVTIGALAATFILALPIIVDLLDALDKGNFAPVHSGRDWVDIQGFKIRLGFMVDQLSVVMLMVVTFVSTLIAIYSTGYMKGEQRYGWFFTVIALFVASMLALVLADNFLLLYAAWEGVGFCSFLLIGFYYDRRSAAEAAKKAFITTRIGDVGLLIGIIMLWKQAGTFDMSQIFQFAEHGGYSAQYLATACLFLFAGAVGKSAQFPLHVWLPDAMEGPTPVSALIHAATMVVAGVYLVARVMPLMAVADPVVLDVVTALGLTTVMISATMGLVATDIKRVIAYSTLNSLGLMMVALGGREVTAAMFYLFVHGFFKALLFLSAGSVIHGTEQQEVDHLGGLLRKLPVTAIAFLVGALSMAGIIPFSGFWAKDEILHAADEHLNWIVYVMVLISVFITALYMTRVYILTFLGQPKDQHAYDHAHESPPVMAVPLIILAALAAVAGFWAFDGVGEALGFPGGVAQFVYFEHAKEFEFPARDAILSTILALAGVGLGAMIWAGNAQPARQLTQRFRPVYNLLANRYYIDDAYQWAINRIILTLGAAVAWFDRNVVNDTGVDGSAGLAVLSSFTLKFTETGKLPNYALGIMLGVIVIAIVFLVVVV
ncbi:MAG TPA: NADH-quinone oxidoreductase subunit L [Dehalococcoidia bacterium]|nr:NADH-quinone oxidoreductase subunit L [Dehalococcoidia bacterium]